MKKDLIYEIYQVLKSKGICDSESEFSMDWLGASEGYMRKARSAGTEPSLGAVAICSTRLKQAADQMIGLPKWKPLGVILLNLSKKTADLVTQDAVEFDLPA